MLHLGLLWIFIQIIKSISVSITLTLSLWKDDNLSISLNEERKACPLTTDSSFVHYQDKPGPGCAEVG